MSYGGKVVIFEREDLSQSSVCVERLVNKGGGRRGGESIRSAKSGDVSFRVVYTGRTDAE